MDRGRFASRKRYLHSTVSDELLEDNERHRVCTIPPPPPLRAFASAGHRCEGGAAYFMWPSSSRVNNSAEERANYFANLQKGVLPEILSRFPKGQRASTLLELITIRAYHTKTIRCGTLGTAVGFRIRKGLLTDIPAILVFVSKKVHTKWLSHSQCLPVALEGPGGIWCDVDVVEISHFCAPDPSPKEFFYSVLADHLRGGDPCIGSGSQVATQDTFGTLGAIVKSQNGHRQVGFLTNRHVAVDLDYPNQKMFHPLPPTLGPSVYLGAVERATSFTSDDLWYGVFAAINPETFVRADGAFVPFADDFDMSTVTTHVKGVGEIGDVKLIDVQAPIGSIIGKKVMKAGSSSGLTTGTVLAYALEYNDEKGICFFNDFLVVGENQKSFDLEGDSGSLIIMKGENGEKPRPIGIIWGGTANRSRIKMRVGEHPVNWTSAVDLGRLLNLLELSLITSNESLKAAMEDQLLATSGTTAMASTVESPIFNCMHTIDSPEEKKLEPLGLNFDGGHENEIDINVPPMEPYLQLEGRVQGAPSVELQFIPLCFSGQSTSNQSASPRKAENLALLKNGCDEETGVLLQLGANDDKRKRRRLDSNGSSTG